MVATWIESSARGRHGGPVRAGMWSWVVVGTHPIEADQEVWLDVLADDVPLGPLPAYWLENKGVNSFWHVPIPPQAVGVRLRYRSMARHNADETSASAYQDVVVRLNLPARTEAAGAILTIPEGLVGNRMMTARVDGRGSTYDVYFPTVGLHSDVRPSEGDQPQSRSHFRAIVAGLAAGRRLDWFSERLSWEVFQRYQGATNLLVTELNWRHGPIRVLATDFIAKGDDLPRTAGGTESPGQYIKRFRINNEGTTPRRVLLAVYVHAEVNGGIGEPGLMWRDGDRCLLATNRGHSHANRKLARDATVEFALALDGRGETFCEPTGPNEAILLRWLDLPPDEPVTVDLLVSGAFTGWRGDQGTFEHWIRPALAWFRGADLDAVEQATAEDWDEFIEPLPTLHFPRPVYAVSLRRSSLAAALHADAKWGAIASGFDRGLSAYCWPRDAVLAGGALDRVGHPHVGRRAFEWLNRVRAQVRPFTYWFQKYTIDGWPEWETPAVDQTAVIPWGMERHYRRTGDLDFVEANWSMVEQAAAVCGGTSGHPGLSLLEDISLIRSGGLWDNRYGAFLYGNVCVVAGLRAASRLAELVDRPEAAAKWSALADRIWNLGILNPVAVDDSGPGLVDAETGTFLEARRLSTRRALWTGSTEEQIERASAIDVSILAPVVPFGLLPATDPRVRRLAEAVLKHNLVGSDPNSLARWSSDPNRPGSSLSPGNGYRHDLSSLATLWMVRYLLQLGRETGDGRHWARALAMLDALIARLGPLGLILRPDPRTTDDPDQRLTISAGAWGLHAMLIESLLDLAGLDYDVPARRLILEPTLPPSWPHLGLSQPFRCGAVDYRLERPVGGSGHRLTLVATLDHPVTLQINLTCPGLTDLGPWHASPAAPPPAFDRVSRRLSWSVELPEGQSTWEWAWG
ncbi:MAG: glycosyl hydrolase [Isosphaeraceae bacterium]